MSCTGCRNFSDSEAAVRVLTMRVFDIVDKDSRVFAFEVPNIGLRRAAAVKVVKRISGVAVLKEPKTFSSFREDVFCEFEMNGHRFEIMEPFGDNSRYWIGPHDNAWHPEIEIIKRAFAEK